MPYINAPNEVYKNTNGKWYSVLDKKHPFPYCDMYAHNRWINESCLSSKRKESIIAKGHGIKHIPLFLTSINDVKSFIDIHVKSTIQSVFNNPYFDDANIFVLHTPLKDDVIFIGMMMEQGEGETLFPNIISKHIRK